MSVEQTRNEIDQGKTGDKVAFPDPAAAPLGTDDEAAGAPSSAAYEASHQAQVVATTGYSPGATDETSRDYSGELVRPKGLARKITIIVAAIVALVAAFVGFVFLVLVQG